MEALGISVPGEQAPPPILQPPPLFPGPPQERRPLELRTSEVDHYLLTVKQDLRQFMRDSPFYLRTEPAKKDIIRYSDKYKRSSDTFFTESNDIDHQFFPRELWLGFRNVRPSPKACTRRKLNSKTSAATASSKEAAVEGDDRRRVVRFEDGTIGKKLDSLEQRDKEGEVESDEEGAGEEEAEEEFYDEELEEEGTDYNLTYFDNGEDFAPDEDEEKLEDGPSYY